ncbi:MAG: TetR/AcrR family transcriptional regulator [Bryobacteraceae bacterium]|nr:TetR/AcrR family transcriptional regulator [Bryobacteraceae bacterium]
MPESPRPRDRELTRRAILEAAARLLARDGFQRFGVSAVAREAGVDKVLIYRYFGGAEALLRALASEGGIFPSLEDLLPASLAGSPRALARHALICYARWLRRHPYALALLRWEMLESNHLTAALAACREEFARRLLERLPAQPPLDLPALAAILAAGVTYLTLRTAPGSAFCNVPLEGDAHWERIEQALALLVDSVLPEA